MGQACSNACDYVEPEGLEKHRSVTRDPEMYELMRKSVEATSTTPPSQPPKNEKRNAVGQHHLLYKSFKTDFSTIAYSGGNSNDPTSWLPPDTPVACPTRVLVRQHSIGMVDEGGGTHIYAIRYPEDIPDRLISEQAIPRREIARQEQCPTKRPPIPVWQRDGKDTAAGAIPVWSSPGNDATPAEAPDVFSAAAMASVPQQPVLDWVTISEEHNVYVADVGLTATQCDYLVNTTEQVCRGQYAAYTYAKQTLGCREYPNLAKTTFSPVHTVTSDILQRLVKDKHRLQLDDREPHVVKYDVTKKERQKLDMHTDKSEWTFLIALSNGCGVDYEGGGTYFECLDATVHIQRGHALIFPGKLRHCGQKITSGLRFLLVGFLVDKSASNSNNKTNNDDKAAPDNSSSTLSVSGTPVNDPAK